MNTYENEFSNQLLLVKNKNEKDSVKEFTILLEKIAASPLKGNHRFIPIIADTNIIEATRIQINEK